MVDIQHTGHVRRTRLRNVLLAGGALIGLAFLFSTITRPMVPIALIGEPAPLVTLPMAGGGTFDLAQHLGDVVVLDFWATWCPPCRVTMPVIDRVVEDYADRGVHLYFVNEGEPREVVEAFAAEAGLSAPIVLDADHALGAAFEVQGLPFTVIVDRDGAIRSIRVGASMEVEEELRADLEKILAPD